MSEVQISQNNLEDDDDDNANADDDGDDGDDDAADEKPLRMKKERDPDKPKQPAGGSFGCFMGRNRAEFQKQCKGQPSTAGPRTAWIFIENARGNS